MLYYNLVQLFPKRGTSRGISLYLLIYFVLFLCAAELDMGRVDPWIGLGRVGSGHKINIIWRVGSGQVTKYARKIEQFLSSVLINSLLSFWQATCGVFIK